tara:strand:- start:154 stop:366 length:213 start_codon:yes stop_codon:yes gene_type:complete
MIKSFENYTRVQRLANNSTQWEKRYGDGGTATQVVSNVGVTRAMVIESFDAQEAGRAPACFEKSDMVGAA